MPIRGLNQQLTWWRSLGPDMAGGQQFAAPVTVNGRWEDSNEVFLSPENEETVSKAVVYLDTDVAPKDYLLNGISVDALPSDVSVSALGPFEVRQFDKTPDLRNLVNERKAFLA